MPQNISDFVAFASGQNSFLRYNQFELDIAGMPAWAQTQGIQQMVPMLCNSANLPGANIDTFDARRYGTGYKEYFPTGVSYQDLITTFYCDSNGALVRFFNQWIQQQTVNYDVNSGSDTKFQAQYRSNYISQINVTQFNDQGSGILQYTYVDAFPVNIEPVNVRWFSRDEIIEYQVVWKYTTWKEVGLSSLGGSVNSFLASISSLTTGFPGTPSIPGIGSLTQGLSSVNNGVSLFNQASSLVSKLNSGSLSGLI